jgi:glycosyltransferase involved in cell wall biosynthesis
LRVLEHQDGDRQGGAANVMSSTRSVLIVGNFLSAAGGSRGVCEELADRLPALGWRVLTTSNRRPKLFRLADMIRTVVKCRHDYAIAQVDVFSGPAFFWAEAAGFALRGLHKPCVLTLHGGNLPAFAARRPGRARRLLSSADIVTAPSAYLATSLQPCCGHIRVIPNPVEIASYPCRERIAVQPKLMWLRAFHEIYNPVMAVKVAAALVQDFPALTLAMAGPDKGDGSFQQTRAEAAAAGLNGRIRFLGQVDKREVPRVLAEADIFLNTARMDNTPVSVIEAMACGLCVVSTNVGGIPCLVRHGQEALLVPPDDARSMTGAVRRLLEPGVLCGALSRNARTAACAFDSPRVMASWNDLLEGLLSVKCHPPSQMMSYEG